MKANLLIVALCFFGTDTAQTKEPDTTPSSGPTTEAPEASSGGLSGGAIAGITVGTIAGVGLVGGGVFGLLKYTKKI
ncbi:hypothetical protein GOODEAATRI_026961 [Goodea atripinnis]|uniref:Uncharacterized protein n=1 Tax=Goodea atripinnis TaxID=208336 RepID=A0ABV0Q1F5_9TELE